MTTADPAVHVVAFGGGHGLSASLRALAELATRGSGGISGGAPEDRPATRLDITAVVTVADDGGSSGRLRAERDTLPPGDLRQALAALAGPALHAGMVARLFQHRFAPAGRMDRADTPDPSGSTSPLPTDWLTGHAVGNLILCGLLDMYADPIAAIDHAAAMVDARGRVLPMSPEPLRIEADVRGRSGQLRTVFGQHSVAVSPGLVEAVRLSPLDPRVCVEAVDAVARADWLIFGPGSWFTSVIPHLLVPDLAKAILASPAKRLVILNLAVEKETTGLSLSGHLDALTRYLPGLRADVVLADGEAVGDGTPRHDPSALASALFPVLMAA